MYSPEYYAREAEGLSDSAQSFDFSDPQRATILLEANVFATLALVAVQMERR